MKSFFFAKFRISFKNFSYRLRLVPSLQLSSLQGTRECEGQEDRVIPQCQSSAQNEATKRFECGIPQKSPVLSSISSFDADHNDVSPVGTSFLARHARNEIIRS